MDGMESEYVNACEKRLSIVCDKENGNITRKPYGRRFSVCVLLCCRR